MTDCFVGESHLYLTHEQIRQQGADVEQLQRECRAVPRDQQATVPLARLKEMKTATGANRESVVFKVLPWASALTFFQAAPLHTLLLGVEKDFWRSVYRKGLGIGAFKAIKARDARIKYIGVPSKYKRKPQSMYPASAGVGGQH